MNKKQKILIGIGGALVAGAGIAYGVNRSRGNSLYDQWMDYANNLKMENNPNAQVEQDINKDLFDLTKKYPGDPRKYIKTAGNVPVEKLVIDFYDAIDGMGTDTKLFYDTLYKIKNLYTFAYVSKVYQIKYKESLGEAILGESMLSGSYSNTTSLPAVAAYVFAPGLALFTAGTIAAVSNKLPPKMVDYLSKLPEV